MGADALFSGGVAAAEWSVSSSADNASNSQTRAAVADKRHFITMVTVSFSAAPTAKKLLTITDGGTTLIRYYADDKVPGIFIFDPPLKCSVNSIAGATLPASGTGGVLGTVSIHGFTR